MSIADPTVFDLDKIPAALKALRQWVLWRGADRVNEHTGEVKLNKIPICPQTLTNADTTDALTWGTFEQCVAALPCALEEWDHALGAAYRGGGLGFVFAETDPYCGIDLDGCVHPDTGTITAWAQTHVDALASYTEVTPSRTGLHILVQGTLPPHGRKKGNVETYDYGRFFTVTGWRVVGTPQAIEDRNDALQAFHRTIFGEARPDQAHAPSGLVTLEDTALLAKARAATNATKFCSLYDTGNAAEYESPSQADMALCNMLAFWSQSPEQIDRLFRLSGLMRKKWDERRGSQTYGARTIAEALAWQTEHYRFVEAEAQRNGPQPGPEPTDPYSCPELPASAKVDEESAKEASIFLDDYVAFSAKWAPRAYAGFHEAAALFGLSTTAARRIKIEFGPHGVYTSLYLALAARTSLFTKTTVADIALTLMRQAGLAPLIAADDCTPQAFLRSLTLYVPPDYGDQAPEAQEAVRDRLAFAGQKGWFYEEWGQHFQAMMSKEGLMAAFRGIMRRLDDHKEEHVYLTIARGSDVLIKPYVSLLANVTPADLKPFLRAQSSLWRDGYIARFAFITPTQTTGSTAPFPEGAMTIPRRLLTELASWHKRLGIPRVTLEPILDAKAKATGHYRPAFVQPHTETIYTLSPAVRTAFYAYDEALHQLMAQSKNEDLDGSYARFPMKALRIAGLLASLHDDDGRHTIWPRHWYRGQQIAERWRADLHKLVKHVSEDESPSRAEKEEQRVIAVLKTHGELTIRDINRWTKLAHSEILQCLGVLSNAGVVEEITTPRAKKYRYTIDAEATHA